MRNNTFVNRFRLFRKSDGRRQLKKQIGRSLRRCQFEQLEKRELLFAANWTNILQPLDVTGDVSADVSPLDVLAVINEINSPIYTLPNSQLLPTNVPDESKRPFLDVDCDQFVSPLDALIIINAINSGNYDPSWDFSNEGGSAGHAGKVIPAACSPKLVEGDSFRTQLSAKLIVPDYPAALKIGFDTPAFDTRSNGLIRDAFEIALLDAKGNAIVSPITTRGTAVYNSTDGVSTQSASGISTASNEVMIGLAGIPAGTAAHVVVRLINNDGDETSQVRIKRVHIVASDLKANLISPPSASDPASNSPVLLSPTLPISAPPLPSDPPPGPNAPIISVLELPSVLANGTHLVVSGRATISPSQASQPANRIQSILINGRPVEALDAAGNFFDSAIVQAGQNRFSVTVTDLLGRSTTKTVALMGVDAASLLTDLSRYDDVSASFAGLYGRTQYGDAADLLTVDLASKNDGTFSVDAPLLVAVANISDSTVKLRNADGLTPQGSPFVNYSNGITGKSLSPSSATGSKAIEFYNPNHVQFKYDLGYFSKINSSPLIGTSPLIEALVGKAYSYSLNATDENGDTLSYRLNESPRGMAIDAKTGKITWVPVASDLGNHNIAIGVNDGRGGTTTQRFMLSVIDSPPNRPPVFTSAPIVDGFVGLQYLYDATARDADGDPLTFQLVDAAPGVQVDSASGRVTWAQAGVWNWDAAKDFTTQSNPSSTWSYGWADTAPGSDIHVYPHHYPFGALAVWDDPSKPNAGAPGVAYNVTTQPFSLGGGVIWQPGQLSFHPGADNERSVVRWTAPSAGSIEIAAVFAPLDPNATTDVHVLHNGRSIFDGVVNRSGTQAELSPTSNSVAAGDTIDFVVGTGTGGFASDNTSLSATVKMLRPSSPITLSVSDDRGGSATQVFNLDVHQAPGNHDPRIVSLPRVSSPYGESYADTVVAVDPDADR
ncbi:MAG TPA: putative Ig domain-containing protein, partial [Pirellula sp.]|nr:putative Ig domain-containing protein [Pirellula sp.]